MSLSVDKKLFKPIGRRKSSIRKIWNDCGVPFLIVIPFMVLFFIFFYYQAISGVWYSMTDWNGIDLKYNFVGLKNYFKVLGDSRLLDSIIFTLKYSLIVSVLINVLGLFIAILLNQDIRFRNMFRGIFFFPAVLSVLTIGYIFNNLYYYFLPNVGKFLHITALQSNILGDEKLAVWGIIFVNVWQGMAMTIVVFLAGFQSIPASVYESAKVEGAGPWATLTRITMPLIVPSIMINLILNIKGSLSVYDYIVALTNGGPGTATESMVMFIVTKGYNSFKFGYSTAASIIFFIIFGLISVIQITYLRKREVQY